MAQLPRKDAAPRLLAGSEGSTRWVTRHLACFASRSTPQLRVEFQGATVTSDAGLLWPRELDERLSLSALIERHLTDPRYHGASLRRARARPPGLRDALCSGMRAPVDGQAPGQRAGQ